jgi:hypothetical protein
VVSVTVALLFVILGFGIFSWSVWNIALGVDSSAWPETEAIVLVSDLQRVTDTDGGYVYRPEISYRYVVEGQEYVASGAKFGYDRLLNWSAPAIRLTRKYRAGSKINVRFDPDRPDRAVIEPGASWLLVSPAVVGLGLIMVGIAVFWTT